MVPKHPNANALKCAEAAFWNEWAEERLERTRQNYCHCQKDIVATPRVAAIQEIHDFCLLKASAWEHSPLCAFAQRPTNLVS